MQCEKTPLPGVFLLTPAPHRDERGVFSRLICRREFTSRGLVGDFVQVSSSFNPHAGTLRGLHYQLPPHGETKLVRCLRGVLFDVVLDLREASPTFGKAFTATLTADRGQMMYVPKGCAHGFLTREPDTEVLYFMDAYYDAALQRGVRWNDPAFRIPWPTAPTVISPRDEAHPDFAAHQLVQL